MKEILDFVQQRGRLDRIVVKRGLKDRRRPAVALGRSVSTG
jgi:hypothetical protein